jgi:hypothetical protein
MSSNFKKTKIYEFNTGYLAGNGYQQIPVVVFIENLPPNYTANVHSTVEFGCSWFIFYSVLTCCGRIEYFHELVSDSDESNYYVLNLDYDSEKAVCSFNSDKKVVFVNSNNDVLDEQKPMFYEDVINNDFKIFLVIFQNTIVLFWNNDSGQVVVKMLNLSLFFDENDFTRVVINSPPADFIYNGTCSITFYQNLSDSNTCFSVDINIQSFLEDNHVLAVLNYHRFNQICTSPFSGSPFIPDTTEKQGTYFLKLSCSVDGSEVDSDDDSEAGSEADSDDDSEADSDDDSEADSDDDSEADSADDSEADSADDSEADSAELEFQRKQKLWEEQLGKFNGTIV